MSARPDSSSTTSPFESFMGVLPGLAFGVTVVNPRSARSWSPPNRRESDGGGLGRTIFGIGKLGEESIVVIGSDIKPAKVVEVIIYAFDSEDELRADWNRWKSSSVDSIRLVEEEGNDAGKRTDDHEYLLRVLGKAYEEFDKRPPTATIQHEKTDWEIRQREHWEIRCAIPRAVLEAIAGDIDAGRCERISLFIEPKTAWRRDDQFPGEATIYGVYSFGALGGYARGWVDSIGWGPLIEDLEDRRSYPAPTDDEDDIPVQVQPPASKNPVAAISELAASVEGLSRTVTRGFVLTLILILLTAWLT